MGELSHNGTTFSLSEGCEKMWEGSQQKDGVQNRSRSERPQANSSPGRQEVKASGAENKALAQSWLGAQRVSGARWVLCSIVFDQHSKSRMVINPLVSMKNRFLYSSTHGSMVTPPISMCVGYPLERGERVLGKGWVRYLLSLGKEVTTYEESTMLDRTQVCRDQRHLAFK